MHNRSVAAQWQAQFQAIDLFNVSPASVQHVIYRFATCRSITPDSTKAFLHSSHFNISIHLFRQRQLVGLLLLLGQFGLRLGLGLRPRS